MRPHISFTELGEFANVCQHRWYLNYVQGLRSNIFSINFDFGTAVHESIEKYLTRKNPVTLDEAIAFFVRKFDELYKSNNSQYTNPVSMKEMKNLIAAGENILRNLTSCEELKEAEVVHNEFPLHEKIDRSDGVDITFKGFIDLVIRTRAKNGDDVLYICDFKTCSWGWDRETRQDRWKQYQLFFYKHYLCKKFDIDQKYVRTAFILLKKRPPRGKSPIEFVPISAGHKSVQRSIDTLNENITEMKSKIERGEFEKNRSSCVDRYGNVCPFYKTDKCT